MLKKLHFYIMGDEYRKKLIDILKEKYPYLKVIIDEGAAYKVTIISESEDGIIPEEDAKFIIIDWLPENAKGAYVWQDKDTEHIDSDSKKNEHPNRPPRKRRKSLEEINKKVEF